MTPSTSLFETVVEPMLAALSVNVENHFEDPRNPYGGEKDTDEGDGSDME